LPASMELSIGEYGYDPFDFANMIEGGACDVIQADVTRCEGITGFLVADSLCVTKNMPLSTHCAPALSAHPAAAAKSLRHIEYFYDHVRIEQMLFDGVPPLNDGCFDLSQAGPGNGLTFKHRDAERFKI
ncbi:MAG: enolase C-terminal domain-like protein, partial [Vulcanimicrobiaceae bacterium]